MPRWASTTSAACTSTPLAAGGVGTARIYDLEPFDSHIAVMRMTPAQMRRMIVAKYNESTREGHRIDLVSTTPLRDHHRR